MRDFFYRPADAWAADFIPLYSGGSYHLFYLLDWRDRAGHGEGTPWYQVSTRDFVHFEEHGEMLARGAADEQDLYVFTGSALEANGLFHIYYTGHNPYFRARGGREQGIMHATSADLLHWQKTADPVFYSPTGAYEPHDWRDPFVFWNDEAGEYWMLVCARLKDGPSRRRGCTALCTSKDLRTWAVRDPLYAPGLYYAHECPDMFKMGDWWYLLFSEFSEACVTRYRMSRSPHGPWLTPPDDTFDGRAFYAAKTATDGQRRFIFGWNPTRENESDDGAWHWGGNLAVHEIVQRDDGVLTVRMPATVRDACAVPLPLQIRSGLGRCAVDGNRVQIEAPGSFGCAVAGPLPPRYRVGATLEIGPGTRAGGLVLRASDDLESGYYIRLEPERRRLVFDRWPRRGDLPFAAELERPIQVEPGQPLPIEVLGDGTVCEVYAGGVVAMSARLYDLKEGAWGVFVTDGSICATDLYACGAPGPD